MPKRIAKLSDQEISLLMRGKEDPDLLSNYFFRKPGEETGWVLDDNFDPEGAWQKKVHHALQTRIVVIGGFGSGKTRGVGISACMHAMTTKNFAFMNCAPTAYQAVIMYNFILEVALDTRFGDLIWEHPRTPYPTIKLRFYAGNTLINSKLEFMSIDKNAVQILSWEGDWVNLDEGGNIDTLGETITHLGSRLRGSINKRARLGRLSIISNSWDNPEMWSRYDMATEDPDNYLSLTVSSRHNHNITPLQLQMMLKDIPEDEHEQFIEGSRPVGKGLYFNQQRVFACEDVDYGNSIKAAAELSIPGYAWYELRGSGVIHYTTPRLQDHVYMILGDPGTGAAPNRNSPVIFVFDVTGFPMTRSYINAMWWGNGRGSITPFIRQLMQFMKMYNPLLTGVDSTGPQASTAEVINTYLHSARETGNMKMDWLGSDIDLTGVMNPWIVGYDFSGSKKVSYLVSGKMFIEASLVRWPKQATGIRRQLTNYDPEKDTKGSALAQDIVATFCMGAFAVRSWFNISPEELVQILSNKDGNKYQSQNENLLRLASSERNERLPREEAREIIDPRQDFPKRYS